MNNIIRLQREANRQLLEMRKVTIEPDKMKHAEGSCLIKFGETAVLCTATVERKLPHWLKGKDVGWITAEYGMLPRATHTRMDRESTRGKQSGRTHEIQRLIGRSLRAVCDLSQIREKQIRIDCDVLHADGGTRTASITGAWVALYLACNTLLKAGEIVNKPIKSHVAGISCGKLGKHLALDLDYNEDSRADVDANFVLSDSDKIIEIQCTAEKDPYTARELNLMLDLAKKGCSQLFMLQKSAIQV